MPNPNSAQDIRSFLIERYIRPARRRGDKRVKIIAGEVHRGLNLSNRVPNVCQVLESKKFREENQLEIEERSGPPSGMGTRMTYVYRLLDEERPVASTRDDSFEKLHGLLKDVFRPLGGGEAFLKKERSHFYDHESSK
jgi:hypothetical protein